MAKLLEKAVTSSEFQTRAGLYLDRTASGPMVITKYGRPSRVLMDFEEYKRLQMLARTRPTRQAIRVEELEPDVIEAIATADYGHIDPELDKLMP